MNKFSMAAVNLGDNSDVLLEEKSKTVSAKQTVDLSEKEPKNVVEKQYVSVKEKPKT
ncbi:hypothetical protein A2U01_0086700, partial [Trifolium medium]|nr:hypothetical protein [Trifolium medium]